LYLAFRELSNYKASVFSDENDKDGASRIKKMKPLPPLEFFSIIRSASPYYLPVRRLHAGVTA